MSPRVSSSANGNVFTGQFGSNATSAPLRGTISIKLSSHSGTAAALRTGTEAGDSEEARRGTSLTSSSSPDSCSQVMYISNDCCYDRNIGHTFNDCTRQNARRLQHKIVRKR